MSNSLKGLLLLIIGLLMLSMIDGDDAISIGTAGEEGDVGGLGRSSFVRREERRSIVSNEDGEITGARVSDGVNGSYYHLQFITLEPNSLFLPVLLHADMVFYVHSGTGRLAWNDEDEMKYADVVRGDVHRLPAGTVFFVQSGLAPERHKLRIYAIFANSNNDLREPATAGPYSSINDLVLGFDMNVLQAAFQVPEDVIQGMVNVTKPPAIVHGESRKEPTLWEIEMEYIKQVVGLRSTNTLANSKTKKLFNILKEDKDFENSNGWSLTVTKKDVSALKGTDIGIFMVNLTKGSMMGPHWNPMATEIAIVLQGQGMVRVVCPSSTVNASGCQDMRFNVNEGDVFVVPRFHPMAQMAFNNSTLVFMGFATSAKNNHPQFLAGKASVLRTLNKEIVAASFNVSGATINRLLSSQGESVILECTSCAEEELRILEKDIERAREEAKEREEAAARKREEERRKEEEEAKRREEERARREEEERRQREQEEEARREEEAAQREEEERRQREQEEAAQREEEERRQREQEEAARREEEEARREEKERRQREEEEARREKEERRQREREEAARREEAERRQREQEEAARREEEEARREEERGQRVEEARRREEAHRREKEARGREEEAAARREEEEAQRRQEAGGEEAAARQAEEEWERSEQEAEEGRRRREDGGGRHREGRQPLKRLTI